MDPYELVQQNNAWSAQQAQKQMDFQERMSNTAHVREIQDLKAAGLNPVLSAKLGGASTPSGAMAQPDTSGTTALIQMASSAVHAAGSAARAAANVTDRTGQPGATFINALEGGIKYLPFKWRAPAYAIIKAYDAFTQNSASGLNPIAGIGAGILPGTSAKDKSIEPNKDKFGDDALHSYIYGSREAQEYALQNYKNLQRYGLGWISPKFMESYESLNGTPTYGHRRGGARRHR